MDPGLNSQQASKPARRKLTWRRKFAYTAICNVFVLVLGELGERTRAWLRYGSAAPSVPNELFMFNEEMGLKVPRPGVEQIGSNIHFKIN